MPAGAEYTLLGEFAQAGLLPLIEQEGIADTLNSALLEAATPQTFWNKAR